LPTGCCPWSTTNCGRLAAQRLTHEAAGQTLEPTALVHEAYLRLVGNDADQHWDNRGHFFAAAAEAMRRILVENVRRKRSLKRGGDLVRHDLDVVQPHLARARAKTSLALDEALNALTTTDPIKGELVKLRYSPD